MLKKAFIALSLTAIGAVSVFAQASNDDYKKSEYYVGYSNGQIDAGADSGNSAIDFFRDRANFNGVNASGVYNVNRYFGIKGDVSGTFNKTTFVDTFTSGSDSYTVRFNTKNQLYNFTGGVQIKDNAKSGVFKPFVHAMVGVAHARTRVNDFVCTSPVGESCDDNGLELTDEKFSGTGFSGIIGGGIDLRLNNRVQIRAIQVDYNPTRIEGITGHNVRLGAGIVF